jgi:hypothetical protein
MIARLALAASILFAASARAEAPLKARRFAFLAAANDGGAGRARLRYASSDAHAVSRVLTEMGGVHASDLVFADEPDKAEFLRQLENVRRMVAASRVPEVRSELISCGASGCPTRSCGRASSRSPPTCGWRCSTPARRGR